jgi:carbon-monoxide dehydrogenase iron sulfur subunit
MNTVFINPERCVGCKQCELACAVAHSLSKDLLSAIAEDPSPRTRVHVERGIYLNTSFPNKCRHCDPAPCHQICPTGAISRQPDMDTVIINSEKCMSCGTCAMICPYDVITFHSLPGIRKKKAVALKCDNCIARLQEGARPACVEACKTKALVYGEINELIKQARTRIAEKMTQATTDATVETSSIPSNVGLWRATGEAVTKTGEVKE